jgi:peptidyl-prolyl cis-trans isomerase C
MTRLLPRPDRAAAYPAPRPAPQMPSACASGGCGGAPAPVRPPAPSFARVRVNGVEIAPEAIAREMQHHPASDAETAWRGAARALAMRELLVQEALRLGLTAEPEADEAGARETEEDALVRALLDGAFTPVAPGPEECRRVYEAEARRFRTPDLFEASHILIEPENDDPAGWAAAEAEARLIAGEIGNDRDAFAAAAREFSKCPSAHQDGSLGQIRRGDLVPVVQKALEALPPATTGREPVRSRFGWHVLRLERRIDGRVLPFEIVGAKIADMLEARAWAMASTRYVAELAQRAEIEGIDIAPPEAGSAGST